MKKKSYGIAVCGIDACPSVRLSVCRCLPATKEDECEGGFKEQEHVSQDALEKSRFMLTIPLWSCIESIFNRSQKCFCYEEHSILLALAT